MREESDTHVAAHKAKKGKPKPDNLNRAENEKYGVERLKKKQH